MISLLYYIVVTLFTLIYLVFYAAVWLLCMPFDRNRSMLHRAGRIWSIAIFRINPQWSISVSGSENIEKGRPYVVVANHQSYLDIPLMYILRFNFKWVSKAEAKKIPVFGIVLQMQDNILIERGERSSTRKLLAKGEEFLKRGVSVFIFPEGTRSDGMEMRKFKTGAFALAQHAGVDILPVVTDGTATMFDGRRIRVPHSFKVKILPPVKAEYIASKSKEELAGEIYEMMKREKDSL